MKKVERAQEFFEGVEMYTTASGTINHTCSVWSFMVDGMTDEQVKMWEGDWDGLLTAAQEQLGQHSIIFVKDGKEYFDVDCTFEMENEDD